MKEKKRKGKWSIQSSFRGLLVEILITKKAKKKLNDLPKEIQVKIKEIFMQIRDEGPSSSLKIKKMRGLIHHYRLRIGNYRVRFEFEKPDKIKIYWVGKISQAYND